MSLLYAAVTLAADADTVLSLSTQEIGLDVQNANLVLGGPAVAPAADPTFRSLVDADIPAAIARDSEVSTAVSDHAAAADPHTSYRLESADHSHQSTGAAAGKLDHGLALDGLADDDHTQYQKESEKGAASGYASLNVSTKVVEQPASISDFLEAAPTDGVATKAPDSNWAFDHNARDATAAVQGHATTAQITKLDGIEALADVTDATNVNAAGAVMEADYNAQTILQATSDNTPVALTVGEQTVVGRITGGNIVALTIAQLQTLALSAALPENTVIILTAVLSADGKYSGIVETGTLGATVAFGEIVYYAVATSKWVLAKADAAATSFGKIGICLVAGNADGATTILLWGKVNAAAKFPALTIGAPVFISAATAGLVTSTAPTGTINFVVRIVGFGNTADELFFCPDNTYLELA